MSQEPRPAPVQPAPGRFAALVYAVTAAVVFIALLVEFFAVYQLLADHPGHAPGMLKETYGAMTVGAIALAVQATLVFTAMLRPARENARELARLQEVLDRHSHLDELTKVLNRTAFEHMIVRELEALKRYNAPFCGILADVDGFRAVNDALGYEAGDHVLFELAQLLRQNIRKADCIFRWRSGRFLILAAGIGQEQAALFAAKLSDVVAVHGFSREVRLSVTLGVAQALPEDSPELFVARIKTALARAKEQGHGSVAQAEVPA